MHRAVLLAQDNKIGPKAVQLTGEKLWSEDETADGGDHHNLEPAAAAVSTSTLVGRTVADVERDLILDTLNHCLGNRTHAANILGISIRTLRNKLKAYSESGLAIPSPHGNERAPA